MYWNTQIIGYFKLCFFISSVKTGSLQFMWKTSECYVIVPKIFCQIGNNSNTLDLGIC